MPEFKYFLARRRADTLTRRVVMEFLLDKTIEHLTDYSAATKLCVRKLAQTYSDLGLGKDEQLAALDKVKAQSMSVWSDACENADTERQALRDRVRELSRSWQLKGLPLPIHAA